MAEYSPMMQQYFNIKEAHPGEILFFRLGDFYEMFFDDALLASKELELTLTGRECGQEERAPMCGVPYHSSEAYIARLVAKGYKVAICEQVTQPMPGKTLVEREVIRVVTPGTVIENSMLEDDRNNYIASIYVSKNGAGLCLADISTGALSITHVEGENLSQQLVNELQRFSPSEVIFNADLLPLQEVTSYIKNELSACVQLMDDICYIPATVKKEVFERFSQQELTQGEGYIAYPALAALMRYLQTTQQHGMERMQTLHFYSGAQYLSMSAVTRANLELTQTLRGKEKRGTLLWVLDKTDTAMGKRLLRKYIDQPLMNLQTINERLNAVEEIYTGGRMRAEIKSVLEHVFDMERLVTRIVYGSASAREVNSLAYALGQVPPLQELLQPCESALLREVYTQLDPLDDVKNLITAAIDDNPPPTMKDGGVIRTGYNPQVDELREIVNGGLSFLSELEARLKEETNIKTLKIGYNKVFGYYIEVSKSYVSMVPDTFTRKQTLTNAERYITSELKEYENKIFGANERLLALERQLFEALLAEISKNLSRIQCTAGAIALLDVLTSLAEVAVREGYTRPQVNEGDKIDIQQGRHPVIEKISKAGAFVPNDALLDCGENRMLVITGPNMAGKSTFMRQTALIVLMAQIGSFVPAKSAQIGIVDSVFTRVGAQDDLASGKSTFMVEMTEVAEILQGSTPRSLVLLDEIGRGTSTFDGMSIAQAVVEELANREIGLGCKTLFATHYHELTQLEELMPGVKNYNIAVKKRGDDITFLRRIVRGPADESYGIEVAKLAGVSDNVVQRAKEILKDLEATGGGATQVSFANMDIEERTAPPSELVQALTALDPETLTPIEALTLLYKLKEML